MPGHYEVLASAARIHQNTMQLLKNNKEDLQAKISKYKTKKLQNGVYVCVYRLCVYTHTIIRILRRVKNYKEHTFVLALKYFFFKSLKENQK